MDTAFPILFPIFLYIRDPQPLGRSLLMVLEPFGMELWKWLASAHTSPCAIQWVSTCMHASFAWTMAHVPATCTNGDAYMRALACCSCGTIPSLPPTGPQSQKGQGSLLCIQTHLLPIHIFPVVLYISCLFWKSHQLHPATKFLWIYAIFVLQFDSHSFRLYNPTILLITIFFNLIYFTIR